MDVSDLLLDLYGRIPPLARQATKGLDLDQLAYRPVPEANSIAWLIWHIARGQDAEGAPLLGTDQLWVTGDWAGRFGLEPDPTNSGFGHTPDDVASVRPESPEVLLEYLDAVHGQTRKLLEGLTPADLDRIIDRSWDPPVTLGVRLISVADDGTQHAGQAGYLRGLILNA